MFAGHVGAAMAIGRAERRVNLGALIFAAVFLDFVLWLFVLLGWESVTSARPKSGVFRISNGAGPSVIVLTRC